MLFFYVFAKVLWHYYYSRYNASRQQV